MRLLFFSIALMIATATTTIAKPQLGKSVAATTAQQIATEKGYSAEQQSQIEAILIERNQESAKVRKQQLEKSEMSAKIKEIDAQSTEKLNQVMGTTGSQEALYKMMTTNLKAAKTANK